MSNSMIFTKDVIIKLKEVREEKGLSLNDVLDLIEKNNEFVSKTTLSRVFAEGSEEIKFRYEDTIRPIANALLDMETIEADDDATVGGLKSVLKYKMEIIEEQKKQIATLKSELDKIKIKNNEKLDKERERFNRSVEFLKEQVSYKDKRMDFLLDAVKEKDAQYKELLALILSCPCRKKAESENNA